MNIILISECTKSSAKNSRRILSKYARNIARRTWIASITQEGLDYLQQELLQIANKNTAIVCHKVVSRSEIRLEWIVGSHKKFDEEGNFAFRYTENIADKYRIELSGLSRDTLKFFSYLNKLAGLFHDVGKNFYYFQNKLIKRKRGTEAGDPIRHEYLSFLCFFHLYEFKADSYQTQLAGLKKNITAFECDSMQNQMQKLAEKHTSFNDLLHKNEKFAVIKLLSHLLLSHHRLIQGNDNNGDIRLSEKDYFNQIYDELSSPKLAQIFQLYQQQALVLFDPKWQEQVGYCVDNLIRLLNDKQTELDALIKDENLLMSITHYILRPALIMADQSVSARLPKTDAHQRTSKSYLNHHAIANPNQSLLEHLTGVGQQSFKNNKVLWQSILSRKRLYHIAPPRKLLKPVAKSLSQFHWQDAAVNAIKAINKKESFGFFAVVMAKTGAGKTQANAKIMAALDNKLRFSTLLGLRTLTLQTLDEYRDNLGIQKHNILGVIGDNTTRILHEADKKESDQSDNNKRESSTLKDFFKDEKDLKISKNLFKDVDTPFPEALCFSNDRDSKLDAITKIPVLVATIDYIISGIDATRSSKTRFLTRLMTSDIIIDEIDSYNQNDLMAIHKLAYLTGFYGKKLIVSSATLPELLIESFYQAYSTGYQRFKSYTDKQHAPLYLGLFTHVGALNKVTQVANNKKVNAIISPFVDAFEQQIKQEPVKRRATALDISGYLHQDVKTKEGEGKEQYEILAGLYAKIFTAAQQLHNANHDKIDGISISTGLIKFNNTEDAYHFSHYLFNEDAIEQDAVVKIECYHARHFPIRRNYTEKTLNQLLNRKKGNGFKKLDIVKNAIRQAKQQGKQKVLLLVVSTTIIEIGRDFDFDWGIIEPRSHWSIIQTVGRIMRHRTKKRYDNVVLLSHSMKAVRQAKNGKGLYYSRPGVEIKEGDFVLDDDDKCKPVQELFEYDILKHKIDASITLKNKAGQRIKDLENQQIAYFNSNKNLAGLQNYLNEPLEYLSTFNTKCNPFRGKYLPQFIYQLNDFNQWEILNKKTGDALDAGHFEDITLQYIDRSLLNKSLEDIEAEYLLQGIELKREIISMTAKADTKKYNEILGVL